MGCRGVHFGIDGETATRLLQAGHEELVQIVQEDIEEAWDEEWLCETDKAWDAIHRCLTDGRLEWDNGEYPLNRVILGGKRLTSEEDYMVCLVPADQIPDVANALQGISHDEFRKSYFDIPQAEYDAELCEEDCEYTLDNLKDLVAFFTKCAEHGRSVIFTVDQ